MHERPKPQQRDGWPAGLQFVLGITGIVVTVVGVIALNKAMKPKAEPAAAPVTTQPQQEQHVAKEPTTAESQPDPDYLPGRPDVLNSRELEAKGYRCISGQLFRKRGNEWQQLGRC